MWLLRALTYCFGVGCDSLVCGLGIQCWVAIVVGLVCCACLRFVWFGLFVWLCCAGFLCAVVLLGLLLLRVVNTCFLVVVGCILGMISLFGFVVDWLCLLVLIVLVLIALIVLISLILGCVLFVVGWLWVCSRLTGFGCVVFVVKLVFGVGWLCLVVVLCFGISVWVVACCIVMVFNLSCLLFACDAAFGFVWAVTYAVCLRFA